MVVVADVGLWCSGGGGGQRAVGMVVADVGLCVFGFQVCVSKLRFVPFFSFSFFFLTRFGVLRLLFNEQ